MGLGIYLGNENSPNYTSSKFTPSVGGRSTHVLQMPWDRALGRCVFEGHYPELVLEGLLHTVPAAAGLPAAGAAAGIEELKAQPHCPTSPLYSLGSHYYHDSPFSNLVLIN